MPVWSHDELQECRKHLFAHLSSEIVEDLFFRWGGIARYVLQLADDTTQQSLLDEALDGTNLSSVIDSFGKSDASAEASSRLIHVSVKDDFNRDTYLFASGYVADEVYKREYEKNRENLIAFISASDGIGETSTLRGTLFERHAHRLIAKGGIFNVRELKSPLTKKNGDQMENPEKDEPEAGVPEISQIHLPPRSILIFDQIRK
jgi:hypothetical protein